MPVKNICDCPNPPGGNIACALHQMAFCGVINGVLRRECLEPPTNVSPLILVNWAVEQITGRITSADKIDISTLQLLKDGRYIQSNQAVVKFVLPASIKEAINTVESLMEEDVEEAQSQEQRKLESY